MNLNFKAVIVGAIVALCLAPFLDVLIFSILGGLVVGLWIADSYLDGAINGTISTFITSIIFFPVLLLIYHLSMFYLQPLETTLLWIICILLGGLGAIIGVSIRKLIITMQKWRLKSKLKDNGYLLCTKCGEHYELKDDETPKEYAKCECGGKFEYKKPVKSDKKSEDLDNSSIRIRIIAILSGTIILFLFSLFFNGEVHFSIILAGFITSFIAGGRYKDGIFNCAVASLIGGILILISSSYLGYSVGYFGYSIDNMTNMAAYAYGFIQDGIACVIGGIIGIYIKNRRRDKGVLKGIFVCEKCKSYYELPPGETPENYDLTCECGSRMIPAKKTSLIVLVIGYIFAISGGFIGLFIGWYLYTRDNPNAKFHGRNIIIISAISIIIGIFLFFLYPNYK